MKKGKRETRVNPLTDWIGSCPGDIRGTTQGEAFEKAYDSYRSYGGVLNFEAFKTALLSAGYMGTQFMNRDTEQYEHRLQLPERPQLQS